MLNVCTLYDTLNLGHLDWHCLLLDLCNFIILSPSSRFSHSAFLNFYISQILRFSNPAFLKSFVSHILCFSNPLILKSFVSQILCSSNPFFLKFYKSQNPAFLKFCISQILRLSNSAFSNCVMWGRHHQLDDSLVGQLTREEDKLSFSKMQRWQWRWQWRWRWHCERRQWSFDGRSWCRSKISCPPLPTCFSCKDDNEEDGNDHDDDCGHNSVDEHGGEDEIMRRRAGRW